MYLHHFCILGGLYIKIQHHQLHHILQQVVAESCVGQKVPSCWIYTPSTCLVGQRWRCLPNWSWPKCRRRNLDGWGASQRVEVMMVLACLDSFDRYVEQNYMLQLFSTTASTSTFRICFDTFWYLQPSYEMILDHCQGEGEAAEDQVDVMAPGDFVRYFLGCKKNHHQTLKGATLLKCSHIP